MALEAGETMHQVFAAVRIWQLEHKQDLPDHALAVADRIFGLDRWALCLSKCDRDGDDREYLMQLSFAILHTSDWYDDPNDNVRTMSNMEMASIHYIDERLPNMENWPIYIRDKKKPKDFVGIEQAFDVVLIYNDGARYRYIGTLDGLMVKNATGVLYLDENKTASRLDEGWRSSFELSHQVTGYCASATAILGEQVFNSRVTGLKIKPTNKGEDCYVLEPLKRDPASIQEWARWFRWSADLYEQYKDDYEGAPRFTHSCNRYFRPCSLIPFCCDTAEGRKQQYENMVPADLSPSERSVQET